MHKVFFWNTKCIPPCYIKWTFGSIISPFSLMLYPNSWKNSLKRPFFKFSSLKNLTQGPFYAKAAELWELLDQCVWLHLLERWIRMEKTSNLRDFRLTKKTNWHEFQHIFCRPLSKNFDTEMKSDYLTNETHWLKMNNHQLNLRPGCQNESIQTGIHFRKTRSSSNFKTFLWNHKSPTKKFSSN